MTHLKGFLFPILFLANVALTTIVELCVKNQLDSPEGSGFC